MAEPLPGRCRDCRFWNGNGSRPAPCFKIPGRPGRFYEIPADGAAFHAEGIGASGAYLMTGPDFGCTLFAAGKPRFWGDHGE